MSETQQGNNDDGKVAAFTPKDHEEQNNVVVIEKTCNCMSPTGSQRGVGRTGGVFD